MADTVLQPIDEFVREGFAQKVKEQFRAPAIYVTSPDALRNLKIYLDNKTPEYPYIFLRQQSVGANADSYQTHRLVREGVPVQQTENQFQFVRILPANFTIEATFITNKHSGGLESLDGFVRRCLFVRRNGSCSFTVKYGMTSLPVTYTIDDAIPTPPRENPTDAESVYSAVVNITVHGYVSEPALATRGRIRQIILSDSIPTLAAPNAQFKSFNRS